jgi:hypothetical protein
MNKFKKNYCSDDVVVCEHSDNLIRCNSNRSSFKKNICNVQNPICKINIQNNFQHSIIFFLSYRIKNFPPKIIDNYYDKYNKKQRNKHKLRNNDSSSQKNKNSRKIYNYSNLEEDLGCEEDHELHDDGGSTQNFNSNFEFEDSNTLNDFYIFNSKEEDEDILIERQTHKCCLNHSEELGQKDFIEKNKNKSSIIINEDFDYKSDDEGFRRLYTSIRKDLNFNNANTILSKTFIPKPFDF